MQQFVCPFFAQLGNEKKPLSLRAMKKFLADYVIVDGNSEEAGSAPKTAGDNATVSLHACIGKLIAMPPEVKLPLIPATLRQVADKDGWIKIRVPIAAPRSICPELAGIGSVLSSGR